MKPFPARRRHCFEFCDQAWLSGWTREAYVDCLNFVISIYGIYRRIHPFFLDWCQETNAHSVVDLASGGGGPIETLITNARSASRPLPKFILTDRFPNLDCYATLQKKYGAELIDFLEQPLEAEDKSTFQDVPRMICSALHHFEPEEVRDIFRKSLEQGGGIFVMEPLERKLSDVLLMILSGPFVGMLAPFFCARFSWKKLLVTTLIPIIPLMVQFDGIMSCFRSYTVDELESFLPQDLPLGIRAAGGKCSRIGGLYFYAHLIRE